MKVVGEVKPDVEVHALIPTVENMPDGKAYRPDDIIVYKNGVSVEVHSTDAEGRLILADALIYGSELEPDVMIDMATLTGACVVALGHYTSGLFTEDDRLANKLLKVSKETGEKLWRMPLDEDLKEDIKGTYADVQNVGKTRYGGAITAALFLQKFVDSKKVKSWAHIDIAGPAFLDREWKYYAPGATGQPVRTVAEAIIKGE
jgi:leucyl aminopeptidase